MPPPILSKPPYARRAVPVGYDAGWFGLELANIARAVPSLRIRTVVGATDIPTALDHTILYDTTAGACSVQLPQPAQALGLYLTLKKISSDGNAVTLIGTVDGATNPTLSAQYDAKTIQSDGTQYYLLATV